MTILLPVGLVVAALVTWGFISTLKQRGIDRSHFAAFVGFSAALVAVGATTLEFVMADLQPHSMNPTLQGFLFVTGVISVLFIAITFFAGLFSRGTQRIALVSCAVVIALMYLSVMVAHFGD